MGVGPGSRSFDRNEFDAMNLAVSRANPRQVYLAGHEVFQLSTDGGATWRAVDSDLPGLDIQRRHRCCWYDLASYL